MNQQKTRYLERLLFEKSPKSVAISIGQTSMKLNKITASIQQTANPQISQQRKIIKSRYLSQNKFVKPKLQTQANQKSKSQLLGFVQEIKRVRTEAQNNLNNTNSHLNKLKLQKKIVNSIRRQKEVLDYIKKIDQEKNRKKLEQEIQQKQIKNRQKLILHRLQVIENQRSKRRAAISQKLIQNEPRYKLIEKQYLVKQIQKQLQDKAVLKSQKDFKQKYKVPQVNRSRNQVKVQKDHKKKYQHLQDNQQNYRLKKIIQFKNQLQKKSRNIMLSMSKKQANYIQIIKDKNQNSLKYNFLRAKNLTDDEIFNYFKDFQLNFNAKSLGNLYLKSLKNKHLRQSRIQANINIKLNQMSESDLSREQQFENSSKMRSNSNDCQNIAGKSKQLKNVSARQETQRTIVKSSSNQKIKNKFVQKMVDQNYLQFLKAKIQSFHKYPFL